MYIKSMKNIEQAIKAEQEYLQAKTLGEDKNFSEMLKQCGYDSIEDFQFDKKIYKLRNLDFTITRSIPEESEESTIPDQPIIPDEPIEPKNPKRKVVGRKRNRET